MVTCRECRGQGVKVVVRQIGPGMLQQMQVHCDQCEGKGEICSAKDRCKECSGEKVIKTKKTLTVHIDKGMKQGSKIVFRQESDQAPGIIPGDVVVALEQDAHPDFTREGNNRTHTAAHHPITNQTTCLCVLVCTPTHKHTHTHTHILAHTLR